VGLTGIGSRIGRRVVERRCGPPLHGADEGANPCRSPSTSLIVPTRRDFGKGVFAWRASLVPDDGCRAASLGEPLVLSSSIVSRGVVLLEPDQFGELHSVDLKAAIVLARCPRCGTRVRVLPYDVLPYKQYSLAVIAELVSTYSTGAWSLRDVVWDLLGEHTPSHTTLHGWTEGLGAHVLGLPGGEAGGVPFSRFVVEARARVAALAQVEQASFRVDERRYRSEARRERLAGVAMLIAVAQLVAGAPASDALARCRGLALVWSSSCVLVFPSRLSCTPIEHRRRPGGPRCRHPPPASRDRCPTRTRSPPGASSRSRP